MLVDLFEIIYDFLKNFVSGNKENQILLHSHYIDIFIDNLKYDLGQIDLLCEIFKNNTDLLRSKIDNKIV